MLRKFAKGGSAGTPVSRSQSLSIIGADMRIVGDIFAQGEAQIDGQIEGDLTCQTLVIGEGARIIGEVTAETVRVHGHLTGKVTATHVTIAKSAHVVGDIIHETLEIEAGGSLEGHLIRKDTPAPATAETQSEAVPDALAAQ